MIVIYRQRRRRRRCRSSPRSLPWSLEWTWRKRWPVSSGECSPTAFSISTNQPATTSAICTQLVWRSLEGIDWSRLDEATSTPSAILLMLLQAVMMMMIVIMIIARTFFIRSCHNHMTEAQYNTSTRIQLAYLLTTYLIQRTMCVVRKFDDCKITRKNVANL